jgi:hypothetical protein
MWHAMHGFGSSAVLVRNNFLLNLMSEKKMDATTTTTAWTVWIQT